MQIYIVNQDPNPPIIFDNQRAADYYADIHNKKYPNIPMALSSDQLNELVEMYAVRMVDNMDVKTMEAFIFDTIVENMGVQSEEDIIQHLSHYYDDDELSDMIEVVGGDAKEVLDF